jgi:tetratricopeptide (TPR) repeat protein
VRASLGWLGAALAIWWAVAAAAVSGGVDAEASGAVDAGMSGGLAAGASDVERVDEAIASYRAALDTPERDLRLEGFRKAERLFSQIVEAGASNPELYTNLGNAALQAEHLGTAVLAYRRALAIDPDSPRALQNLEFVRTLLPDWVPKPESGGLLDSFFFWHKTRSRSDRSLGAAIAFAVAALLLAAAIRFGQSTLRNAAILPALVWAALLASVALEGAGTRLEEAVVIADEAVARAADSALAPSALPAPLPAGAEVRILERRSPWTRIRLANGRDAWVAESALMPVEAPELAASDRPQAG